MKILVTGNRGFLGSHLVPALKKKGHHVIGYDIKDGKDILDIKKLEKAIKKCDVVYHLAALINVQESHKQRLKYKFVNYFGTGWVVYYCRYFNKKLIYTSTAAIHDFESSTYAHTKFLADVIVQDKNSVVLRLFNVYGEGMNESTMLARFQKENPITIYGDGKQTRDFIHIDDVVEIMVSALDKKWNGFVGDIGTAYEHTVLYIAKLFKKPIQFKEKRKEVRKSVANIKALRKLYKKPFIKIQDYIDKKIL